MEALNILICPNYVRPSSIGQPDTAQKPIVPQSGIVGITWRSKYNGWQVYKNGKYLGQTKSINKAKAILRRSCKK